MAKHPRDTYITVYGRKPVYEVVQDMSLQIDKVGILHKLKGDWVKQLEQQCKKRNIPLIPMTANEVARLSKHPKEDQGVVADVVVPNMEAAKDYFERLPTKSVNLIAMDGVTTPANVGLIIRSATGLGIDGIVLPRKGNAKPDALVIKASAGVLFKSRLLKCEQLQDVLPLAKKQGFTVYGLDGQAKDCLYDIKLAEKCIFVMGNESKGLSKTVAQQVDVWLSIPMAANVESLNVACAATIVATEVQRRKYLGK